ncbi:hypothetical protein [Dyadobacter sp. CY326]|uniref:hypothetical protein n=1 Tax=Dyadobacter sp. CY326 TaxID=2907300 RepID=UPI001F164679|nr:hypothetical protein [Dyadobacter sp. CY326]MCE7066971.1 hypothetical protein [Dyadobacter sp. CY326]
MNRTLALIVCLACLCWQCKEKKEPVPQPGSEKVIDVLDFSIPGADQKNIRIGKDVIVVNLPENYAPGDYIKPVIVPGTGYSTQSPILNGVSYEDQEITLDLESKTRQSRKFNVIVIPFKAINVREPAKNLALTIGPDAHFAASFDLKGTKATVNEGEKLIYEPLIRFKSKATGEIVEELYIDPRETQRGDSATFTLPGTILPGEYTAEVVWGQKTEILTSQFVVKSGPVFFKRGSWHMLEADRYFEINGFNFSPTGKYEAIIENDFMPAERINLKYEKAGTLSGNLPPSVGLGNYKITYLENGKKKEPYLEKQGIDRYSGDDHFYIQKTRTQPIARIVTQPSRITSFKTYMGLSLNYYASATEINRQEPIIVYTESWGPATDKFELILIDHKSRKEYKLAYSGTVYSVFDGFLSFPAFPVTKSVPNGQYEVYILRNSEKTERYSQIITLK